MSSSLRRRNKDGGVGGLVLDEADQTFIFDPAKPKEYILTPATYTVFLISFGCIMFFIAFNFLTKLPSPNEDKFDRFIARRAIADLEGLVKIGPKVTGSEENEVKAVKYLMGIINNINSAANPVHKMEMDLQIVSGSFSIGGLGLHYSNVQNIVVRIGPKNNASLLINCHFDSVPSSPGASDDGLNCATMLEVLRVITSSKEPLSYGAIFLFNGAEENPLLASHGFITQHKWAKEVRAFINLESCGAGGQETLFQTGPKAPWLVEAYSEAAVHPFGTVIGEEIFQSGIIPSDTDFRIFRDYGSIPGLDFAHSADGYVYHTKRDNLESIPNLPGVIQHTGDNLLSLVELFTGKKSNLAKLNTLEKVNSVYFDLFGFYFITFSENTGIFLAWITILLSCVSMSLLLRSSMNLWILVDVLVRPTALFTSLALSSIYNLLLAVVMDSSSSSMTWFTFSYYLIPLYIMPTIVITSLTVSLFNSFLNSRKSNFGSTNTLLQFLPTQLFWTIILLITTFYKLRSTYLLVMLVLPPAVAFIFLTIFYKKDNEVIPKIIYFMTTILCSLYITYNGIIALKLFLPITGRAGTTLNPDLLIAVLVTLLTFAIYSYVCCLSINVKSIDKWGKYVMMVHAGVVCALVFTNIGFPFTEATPQRFLITDVTRNSSQPDEAILWIEPWQRRATSVLPMVAALPKVKQFCTKTAPHCGLPWASAKLFMKSTETSRWLPSDPHPLKDLTQLQVVADKTTSDNIRTITFKMIGPSHMTLMMYSEMTLKSWSLDQATPLPVASDGVGKTYVIRHVHGKETPWWEVTLNFKVEKDNSNKLHVDFVGHHIHGATQTSPRLEKFAATLPTFVHVTPSLATLKAYSF